MPWRARLATLPWRLGLPGRPPAAVSVVIALAVLAWIALALDLMPMAMASSGGATGVASGPPWLCALPGMHMGSDGPGGSGGPVGQALAGMPMWSLMAVAMMLPAALPATAHVATNSLRRRRGRAVSEFLLAYLALWLAFGAVTLLVLALVPLDRTTVLLVAVLGLAAAWELSPAKRWALNHCHRTSPLPPSGWRAGLGSARFGFIHGGACVASCWPLMVVMAVAPSARLAWCAGLAGLSVTEKLALKPRRATRRAGLALVLGTVAAVLAVPLGI
jgi:predicted metal-binding membrane protein